MEKIFHWTNTFKTLGENDDGSISNSKIDVQDLMKVRKILVE